MTIIGGLLGDARRWLRGDGEHAAGTGSLPGCDVSSFNGPPADWRTEAGRISFAAVKISELSSAGPYVNPDAAQDWSWLADNGKGRIGYLFARPDTSATATAGLFTGTLAKLGLHDGDGVAIDLEVSSGKSPREVAAWTAEVAALLERELDRVPLLYTFLSFAQEGNCVGLGHLPLWMSDPSSPKGRPRIPKPWKRYAIHQFSVSGGLDRDVANFPDLADMQAAIGRPSAAPTILEDPVLILTGAGADTPVALPEGAKTVRLVSIAETTVNVEFAGAKVLSGVKLSWGHGRQLDVPKGSHSVRVYRPADGKPDVPVSVAVS